MADDGSGARNADSGADAQRAAHASSPESGRPADGAQNGARVHDTDTKHLRRAIWAYAALFTIWLCARFVDDLLMFDDGLASGAATSTDSALVEMLPPEIRLPPTAVIDLGVAPTRTAEDTVVGTAVSGFAPAAPVIISRPDLFAADTALLPHLRERTRDLVLDRHRLGLLADVPAFIALIGALAIVSWLASGAVKHHRDDRWSAVSVYVLIALLVILAVEVGEWLVSEPPDRRLLSLFKGVALASAMGGVTYVLINIAAKWREAYQRLVYIRRRERAYLVAKRRRYEEELKGVLTNPDKKDEEDDHEKLIARYEKKLKEIDDRLQELVMEEMDETQPDLKVAYGKVHMDRRVVHVVMSMLLAMGFVVVALALGIDFFTVTPGSGIPHEQYAAAVLALAFLVGMFPRVFERFMKGVADRLIGGADEDEDPLAQPMDFDLEPRTESPKPRSEENEPTPATN